MDAEPEWIVNDNGELGVKVGNRCFFLYKGESLEYVDGLHDDGTPILYRSVGKREFGECCHPISYHVPGAVAPDRYTVELDFNPNLSFGTIDDAKYKWKPIRT